MPKDQHIQELISELNMVVDWHTQVLAKDESLPEACRISSFWMAEGIKKAINILITHDHDPK